MFLGLFTDVDFKKKEKKRRLHNIQRQQKVEDIREKERPLMTTKAERIKGNEDLERSNQYKVYRQQHLTKSRI